MLFNQMRDKVMSVRNPEAGWKYGNWNHIFYDENANLCYVGHKKYEWGAKRAFIGYSTLQESPLIFRPDNVAMINNKNIEADYFLLRSTTINGKINKGRDFRSRYRYTHDLQHEYEVVPYMELSMKNGKPIKARLLSNVPVDHDRLAVVRSAVKRMRAATQALIRCGDNKIGNTNWQESNAILDRYDENSATLAKMIQSFIDNHPDDHWAKFSLKVMSAYHPRKDSEAEIKRFDSMIRFHDAAVFRHLGVTR